MYVTALFTFIQCANNTSGSIGLYTVSLSRIKIQKYIPIIHRHILVSRKQVSRARFVLFF